MRCGLLGRTLGHSYSPQIHSLLGDYSYELFEKEPEELEDFLQNGDFQGLNVTIPYKKAVVPYCKELSPRARELGSVNTLVRRSDGSLYGDNTDYAGFHLLASLWRLNGKKVLVLGSGGASVTVRAVLKAHGCRVIVISRQGLFNYDNLELNADAEGLVNTTPLGTYPNVGVSALDLDRLPNLKVVVDLIYNPARTKLLLDAEDRGISCVNGLLMLVAQAAEASRQWTGKPVTMGIIETIYRQLGRDMENIVLIGMPGCGKSTVGKKLAAVLHRPFVDTDVDIVDKVGDIHEYFVNFGEDRFRAVETEVLDRVGKGSGQVLSTGGGCVTREENYRLLHQNGRIFWIKRDLEKLSSAGRPLSQRDGVEALYRQREGKYRRFADDTVDNNGSVDETVREILRRLQR